MEPECKIVHSKPRHPQSQGSVERANADVKDMVITWMRDNHCKDWPVGVKFVQFEKNRSHHSGINRAQYKAMFGVDARVGLTSSSLPDELVAKIDSQEHLSDLENMELNINTDDENTCTTDDEQMEISEPQPTEQKKKNDVCYSRKESNEFEFTTTTELSLDEECSEGLDLGKRNDCQRRKYHLIFVQVC
ncbi:unnamed protein product [Mytilus coruscus]|uniref:Integrase catalytic domain-containing protein n=1 Tax=Mytilus coruscus TaxID=42192 RepID=A0A6J8AHL5_MYTCO|nr:unnamed protein product [Mytilus coruscus]